MEISEPNCEYNGLVNLSLNGKPLILFLRYPQAPHTCHDIPDMLCYFFVQIESNCFSIRLPLRYNSFKKLNKKIPLMRINEFLYSTRLFYHCLVWFYSFDK